MILFGYHHDFFLARELHHTPLSVQHNEAISPTHRKLHMTLFKYKLHFSNTDWKTLSLKEIYNKIQHSQIHVPTIHKHKVKTQNTWIDIHNTQKIHIPNHLKDTNYRTTHDAVATRYYYKHKLHFYVPDTCRHCKTHKETLHHILTECNPIAYNTLKNKIGDTHTNTQLLLDAAPTSIKNHLFYSIYRHTVIHNHLQLHSARYKTDIETSHRFTIECRKYVHLYLPP